MRVEKFGENFRGGTAQIMCPLCMLHLDNQELGFQCPEIKKELKVRGSLEDIYKENIPIETIRTLAKISDIRKSRQD